MKITDVRIRRVTKEGKIKYKVIITSRVRIGKVHDIKVIMRRERAVYHKK